MKIELELNKEIYNTLLKNSTSCEMAIEEYIKSPRGTHVETEKDLLDSIINAFNEKWFHGWEATPQEQRVKFINLMDRVKTHDDFKSKYQENQDDWL